MGRKYYFLDVETKLAQFMVETNGSEKFPLEHAAGLLAIHCYAQGRNSKDYICLAEVDDSVMLAMHPKVKELLEVASGFTNIRLTRREQQVLSLVTTGLANKEIGRKLGLSERTVKFHVSSLLLKFKVKSRMQLSISLKAQAGIASAREAE